MADDSAKPQFKLEDVPWHLGLHDSHCHPTDTAESTLLPTQTATLTVMATRFSDQSLVADLARHHNTSSNNNTPLAIVPSFGHHPWFSHLIRDDLSTPTCTTPTPHEHYSAVLTPPPTEEFTKLLPSPTPLSGVLAELRQHLTDFPEALVGEVGLDRAFRIPNPSPPPPDVTGKLSPHRVSMVHQRRILEMQLDVAGEFGRAVSVHGVQCHGALFELFEGLWKGYEVPMERNRDKKRRRRRRIAAEGKKEYEYIPDFGVSDPDSDSEDLPPLPADEVQKYPPPGKRFPPRICLHSCSAPLQTLHQYLHHRGTPSELFFSFSTTINKGAKIEECIKAVPEESVLIESDLHTAGPELDKAMGEAAIQVATLRGWGLEDAVKRLGQNWEVFVGRGAA